VLEWRPTQGPWWGARATHHGPEFAGYCPRGSALAGFAKQAASCEARRGGALRWIGNASHFTK